MAMVYKLGGRAYCSAAQQITFAQRGYLMGVLHAHRLNAAIDAGGDLLGAILTTGSASALLAGLLVEDEKTWNRPDALANVAFFDGLTAEDDHAQLLLAVESLLAGFFPIASGGTGASPTSSTRRRPRKASSPRRTTTPATSPEPSAGTGPTSLPSSPSAPADA